MAHSSIFLTRKARGGGGEVGLGTRSHVFYPNNLCLQKITSYFFLHTRFPEVFSSLSGGIRAFVALF